MKYTFVDTCFGTHHPQFGYDADDTLWLSGTGPVAGWVNTKIFDETGDAAKAQGWSPFVLDTNGNGKRRRIHRAEPAGGCRQGHAHHRRLRPLRGDAASDRRLGLVHRRRVRAARGGFLRFDPEDASCPRSINVPKPGYRPARRRHRQERRASGGRLASGHLGSFDRRKCKAPLNGPKATGNHCPEGFAFYQYPGPGFEGIGENSAEASYYTWVDQHNTVGLGENVPISTANLQDGFVALKDGKMVLLRVPYPMGFYAKGLDGAHRRSERRLEGPRPVEHRAATARRG